LSNTPNPVDIHVGGRLRLRRILLGYSQSQLGDAVKLTFQQIQKYERGANRISASRLFQFSQVLTVPVSFFFDDMDESLTGSATSRQEDLEHFDQLKLTDRETLILIRAYYAISNPGVRRSITEFVQSVSKNQGATPTG